MSDLQSLIARTASLLTTKTKTLVVNHKKKVIAGVVLIVAGYIIKKKMTMAHLITIIQAISKFVQYLPLPDSPKLRQLAPYEHPQPAPLRAIMNAMKVQQIKARISKKQGKWQQLKDAIFTGATMTLVLYNINSFYFVVQNKYFEQFKQLKAIEPFEQVMYTIRKRFTDQVPGIFHDLQRTIHSELNKIELQDIYSLQQISEIFDQLTNKVFEGKFQIKEEEKKSVISKSSKEVNNLFVSAFEYSPNKATSSLFARAAGGFLSFLAGSIRVFDWFPQAKQETSSQRYHFTRTAYLISLLKSDTESVIWPCEASRNLFELVYEQMSYMVVSLNFSILVKEHCTYNKRVLMNRIHLWLIANRTTSAKTVKMLPAIFKILKEEFFRDDVFQLRDAYHEKELKKNIKQIALAEQLQVNAEGGIEEAVLGEIEGKKHYQYLQKQFELKYFNERSGVVHRPKRQQSQSRQSRDIQKVLSMLGGSEALNQE